MTESLGIKETVSAAEAAAGRDKLRGLLMSIYEGEAGYMVLIRDVLDYGVDVPDRTGVGSRALFDAKVVFDLREQHVMSTARPFPPRLAFEEFWFFLRGETQTKRLEEKGVNFWKANTTREFLDKRGLTDLPEGEMGRSYGAQARRYGKTGFDQIQAVYDGLRNDPYGRRHYVTWWNPEESHLMALTPCWHSHQFVVLPGEDGVDELHLKLLNRSLDSVIGSLGAFTQYSLYQLAMAELLGMRAGRLSADLTHVHVYHNQFNFAREIIERELGVPGVVSFNKPLKSLDDLIGLSWDDITIDGLRVNKAPIATPRPEMAQ